MKKATFYAQDFEVDENGRAVRGPDNKVKFVLVERDWELPNGWEFQDVDDITLTMVMKFEKEFVNRRDSHEIDVRNTAATRILFDDAVVGAAIEAGFFKAYPDKINPKHVRRVSEFVNAYKTDLDIIPENLS